MAFNEVKFSNSTSKICIDNHIWVEEGKENNTCNKKFELQSGSDKLFHSVKIVESKKKGEKRCDFLILNIKNGNAYLVELKGDDIESGRKQLERTAELLKDFLLGYKIHGRLIAKSNRVSRLDDRKWKKMYKGTYYQPELKNKSRADFQVFNSETELYVIEKID